MASSVGAWYLSGSTLQFKLNGEQTTNANKVVAEITGLGDILRMEGDTVEIKDDGEWKTFDDDYIEVTDDSGSNLNGTIAVKSAVLGLANKTIEVKEKSGCNHKVTFDEEDNLVEVSGEELTYDKAGKILVKGDLSAGYAFSGKKATYYAAKANQTLATITGLRKDAGDYVSTASISAAEDNDRTGKITFSQPGEGEDATHTVLGTSDISIKTETIASTQGINYYLDLGEEDGETYEQQADSEYWGNAYWDYSGTTATYKFDSPTGYHRLNASSQKVNKDDADAKATKIKVTAAKTTQVVQVKGLAKELEVGEDGEQNAAIGVYEGGEFAPGMTVSIDETQVDSKYPVTVTFNEKVLGTSNLEIKATSTAYTPTFEAESQAAFLTDVTEAEADIWVVDGSKATYKHVQRTYYKPETGGTKYTYYAQKDLYTYFTLTGLDEDALDTLLKDDNKVTYTSGAEPALITSIAGLSATNLPEYTMSGKKYTVSGTGTITIDADLLGKSNVALGKNDSFKIVIDDDNAAPTFDQEKWNLNGTTATLKGNITGGHIVSADGKTATYTKDATNATLATITGLKSGTRLVTDADGNRVIGFGNEAYSDGGTSSFLGGISINNEALSSNTPVQYSTAGASYNRIGITISKNVLGTGKVGIKSDFYDLDLDATDNAVLSVPTAASADSVQYLSLGTTTTLKQKHRPYYTLADNKLNVTYTNPAKGSDKAVDLAEIKGLDANVSEGDITVSGDGLITINPNALNEKDVTITTKSKAVATSGYSLALAEEIPATLSNEKWAQGTVKGNPITYVANVTAGYKVNSTSTAIVYTPTGEETTLFTITGLKGELAGDSSTGFTGVILDEDTNTVSLSLAALNNADVALKSNFGYDLVLGGDIPTAGVSTTSWVIDGTTAYYRQATTAYYTYYADKDTLKYNKAVNQKNGRSDIAPITTIKGLRSGLFVSEAGSGSSIGYYNDEGEFVPAVTINTSTSSITVTDAYALDEKNVSVTGGGYSISIDATIAEDVKPAMLAGESGWQVPKKGTAVYVGAVSGGYIAKEDGSGITYYKGNETAATIATIKNIPDTVTTANIGSMVEFDKDTGVVEVKSTGLLSTSTRTNVSLETGIPLADNPYTFELGSIIPSYDQAINGAEKVWTVNRTTATFNTSISSAYYRVDGDDSNYISYNVPGIADKLAEIEGLASGLTPVKGRIMGISAEEAGDDYTITLHGKVLGTQTVTLTDLNPGDNYNFGLAIGDNVTTPEETTSFNLSDSGNKLSVYKATTAGFSLSSTSSTSQNDQLFYLGRDNSGATELVNITGLLNASLKSSSGDKLGTDKVDGVDGITISDEKVITLSQKVLGSNAVGLPNNTAYSLSLAADVTLLSTVGAGWVKSGDSIILYENTTSAGYSLAADGKSISNVSAGTPQNAVATLSGLKDLKVTNFQIDGITIDGNEIKLSKNVLDGRDVVLKGNGGYSLALNQDDEDDDNYVAGSESTAVWSVKDGTATFEEKTTEGYRVNEAGTSIIYTKAKTVVTTINNLSKDDALTVDTVGADGNSLILGQEDAITFDSASGIFTIENPDVLAHKNVTLTTKVDGKNATTYALALGNGIEAETLAPTWNKTAKDTKATLNQKTKAGYTLSDDGQKINYSSDPTTATLTTITGLKKEVALNINGTIDEDGDAMTTTNETTAGLSYALPSGSVSGTITVSKDVLATTQAAISGGNYEFAFDTAAGTSVATVAAAGNGWKTSTVSNTTTAVYKSGTIAYYNYATVAGANGGAAVDDKKKINYNADNLSTEVFNITGLKKGITVNTDGTIDGLNVIPGNGGDDTVKVENEVLGSTSATFSGATGYVLNLGDDVLSADTDWKSQTEWVGNGSTYTYKTYDKAHYKYGSNTIKYFKEDNVTEHAKISGLLGGLSTNLQSSIAGASGYGGYSAVDDSKPAAGGTIYLSSEQLNKAKVTLTTTGDFKLAFDTENDLDVEATVKSTGWSTSGNKATLKGITGAGYTLSDDRKTVTYSKDKKTNQTLAQISGIKSGATISDSDVTDETIDNVETGFKVITLGEDQVDTKDITVTGTGYKLAVAGGLESETGTPEWIKTSGSTKATYTQATYPGFTSENAGKKLKYNSKSVTNVDLITINGLNSTLEAVDGKIEGVALNEELKNVSLSAIALGKSDVKITSKDSDYSIAIADGDVDGVKVKDDKTFWSFSKGTASILKGSTEGWTQNGTTAIKYTKANTKTLSTISNLPKTLEFKEDVANPENNTLAGISAAGISVANGGVSIYLGEEALAGLTKDKAAVTLTNNTVGDVTSNYKLALGGSSLATTAGDAKFTLKNTTGTLAAITNKGYVVGTDSKGKPTITYRTEQTGSTITTITGLPKGKTKVNDGKLYYVDGDTETLMFVTAGTSSVVTVTSEFVSKIEAGTTEVTLSLSNGAKFDGITIGDNSPARPRYGNNVTTSATSTKGTLTLSKTPSAGWSSTLSGGNITAISYKPQATIDYATIKGLNVPNGSYSSLNSTDSISAEGTTVTVGKEALNKANVTMTMNKKNTSDVYNLALADNVPSTGTSSAWQNQVEWVASGGKASYKIYDKDNYYVKNEGGTKPNSIVYVKPKDRVVLAEISGLKKSATIAADAGVASGKAISLGADQLGTSKVTLTLKSVSSLTGTDDVSAEANALIESNRATVAAFKLDLADDVTESTVKNAVWDTTKTTAKLTGTVSKGYKLSTDKMSITYQSANKEGQEIAKITGLKSEAEIGPMSTSTSDSRIQIITLGNEHLATSDIKLTGEGYQLSLAGGSYGVLELSNSAVWSLQPDWTASNGTFTYQKYSKAHWDLNDAKNTVKYYKPSEITTKLTIAGLNKEIATSDVDSLISSGASSIVSISSGNNVVTLGDEAFNKAKITLTDKDGGGYTLADVTTASLKSTVDGDSLKFTAKGDAITVKGTQSKGFLLSNDSQSFTYYSKNTDQNIATIAGLSSSVVAASFKTAPPPEGFYDGATNTFKLTANELGDSEKVTIGGLAKFSFANDYNNGSIVGSSASDNISIAGSGISISAGKGNDYVDLGGGSATFFYASGDGNDVIANFTAGTDTDAINITKASKEVTGAKDGNDFVITVDSGKIRLKGVSFNTLSVIVKGETKSLGTAVTSNVLADDNYSVTPQLSSIVKGTSGYMTEDLVATDATSLTKTDTAIAYGGDKK